MAFTALTKLKTRSLTVRQQETLDSFSKVYLNSNPHKNVQKKLIQHLLIVTLPIRKDSAGGVDFCSSFSSSCELVRFVGGSTVESSSEDEHSRSQAEM